MNIQHLAPIQHQPSRARPPFDVIGIAHQLWESEADGPDARRADRVAALLEALDGIELGAHDRRIVGWLVEWEISTVGTIASWLYRVRAVSAEDGADQ